MSSALSVSATTSLPHAGALVLYGVESRSTLWTSGSLAAGLDFGAMGAELPGSAGHPYGHRFEPDGARLRTRQMRPKKTIGRTPRQTPFCVLPHCAADVPNSCVRGG